MGRPDAETARGADPGRPPAGGPYHPKTAGRRHRDQKLGLWDSTAMGVGGMIGGGIFSVLGVAITLAGHLATGCFVVGAVLAALTARSYAGVTGRAGRSGGPFEHLRDQGHAQLSGWLLWLLVFGYMVAMAVYSFTFGRYAADAIGAPTSVARVLSVAVIVAFLLVNLRGVRTSSLTEDLVVLTKLVILGGIAIVGVAQLSTSRLSPLADRGVTGLFLGAATVFFAYEGFELITYDRDDMRDPERTLPRSLYLSVAIVALVYVAVTFGAQMLASDRLIVSRKEVAFAAVGEAALGTFGRWAAIVGAIFATGSAINATLFSTARLVRDASASGELPRVLGRARDGLPIVAMAFISVVGGGMAMLPGITEVIAVGSAAFLGVYTLVNYLQARTADARSDRVLAGIAGAGCAAAIGALVYELARDDVLGLVLLLVFAATVAAARLLFVRLREPRDPRPGSARATGSIGGTPER